MPDEIKISDLDQPISILNINLAHHLTFESLVLNYVLSENFDISIFQPTLYKWVTMLELEELIKIDNEVPGAGLLGPEPLQILIQSLNNSITSLHLFSQFNIQPEKVSTSARKYVSSLV